MSHDAALDRSRSNRAPETRRALLLAGAGLLLVAVVVRLAGSAPPAWSRTYLLTFGSLIVSAIPFVATGAVLAAAIAVFVPITALERIGRLPRVLQPPAAALAGVALPICECGSVPIARRLMGKGLAPSAALTFMLASPIVNPVVMASTYVAYRGKGPVLVMVIGRFGLGMIAAMVVGWVIGRARAVEVLRNVPAAPEMLELARPESRLRGFFAAAGGDAVFMGRYLLLGATIAALVQTFLPQRAIQGVASTPLLDTVVMLALAAVLSLCSESDAFIASSFGPLGFGPSSQLAFLVFGPMVDLKLVAMYGGTFRPWVIRAIVVTAAGVALVGSAWIRVAWG